MAKTPWKSQVLDHILIVDVESTCWEGQPPLGQESEIIEIGLCLLEVASGRRQGKRNLLVRPEQSTVSAFCTQLTGLTQEHVNGGISFADACSLLQQEYASKECAWASYGDYDRLQFERQCHSQQVSYPFGLTHVNIKALFAVFEALSREVGMAEALRQLHLPLQGVHHRAADDAWNIAGLLGELLSRYRSSPLRCNTIVSMRL